ncbi:MAG: GNAT family N-acetyltransferase [Pseudomonadales bacterium]
MTPVQWRDADADDYELLVPWNLHLQEDEGSEPMPLAEIEARMRRWLAADYRVVVFLSAGQRVGYALFRPTDPDLKGPNGVYLRQFFIARECRGEGLGHAAWTLLHTEVFPTGHKVVLEALRSNPGARRFWESLGFEAYSTTYELRPPG